MNALEAMEHPLAAHRIPRLHVTIEWMGQSYLSIKHYPHLEPVRTAELLFQLTGQFTRLRGNKSLKTHDVFIIRMMIG